MNTPPNNWEKADVLFKALIPLVIFGLGFAINKQISERAEEAAIQRDHLQRMSLIPSLIDAITSENMARRQLAIRTVNAILPVDGPALLTGLDATSLTPELRAEVDGLIASGTAVLVDQLFATDRQTRLNAYAALTSANFDESPIVEYMLKSSSQRMDNKNGIVNVATYLAQASPATLAKFGDAIKQFGEKARLNGPQTSALIDQIYSRI